MSEVNYLLADVLLEIEAELRHIGLWETTPPDAEALMSTVPFCADTLAFPQWLQWIFVPRMKEIIEQSLPLPENCEIFPYAEQYCQNQSVDCARLLRLVQAFDDLIEMGEPEPAPVDVTDTIH